jgi:phosphatidylinositol alpha-1,6-mannosyltransferase
MSLIVGLFTDMNSAGGVQRAGRHVAAVAAKFASDRGLSCRFLSLNDPQGLHTKCVGSMEFSFSGHARDKAQFALAALRAAGRKPVLVIAMHPHLAPVAWAMSVRSPGTRSIVFAHGIEVWTPLGWLRRESLRRATIVIGPSRDTVRRLTSTQGVRPEIVKRLPWGLDPEFESFLGGEVIPALPPGFPPGDKIVLTVGRWDPSERYKGADTLISALPAVLIAAPDTFLVLVGDGADRPRLEQLAQDLGVSERTRFLRDLTKDELFACYAGCNLFALPSSGEGFGLVFLEAMAYGKPVVGGAHGGIPDVVDDGVTGLLVPPGDVGKLGEVLLSLLSDPARAERMGLRGRECVEQKFSFGRFQENLTRVLDDAVLRKSW